MKFSELAKYLDKLEKTASRIEITKILAGLFKKSSKGEIDKIVYLLLGQLAPSHKNIVFNVAERMMLQTISQAYAVKPEIVLKDYKRLGDLGDVAEDYAEKKTPKQVRSPHLAKSERGDKTGIKSLPVLSKGKAPRVIEVYNHLLKVAQDSGEASVERKIGGLATLLKQVDPLSARFVARIPVGKLRLGFSDRTVIDALSWMETGDKSKSKELESAYFVLPDVGLLAKEVKLKGADKAVKNVKPRLGTPVMPMLAQRLKSPTEMIEKMTEVSVEPKFDGLRIQIHFKKGGPRSSWSEAIGSRKILKQVQGDKTGKAWNDKTRGFTKAFTRNLNETSWMFPELAELSKYLNAKEAILDTEAVGLDEKTKTMANFQTTMTRRRKHNIAQTAKNIGIKFYVFDILIKDKKNLMDLTYIKRREILDKTIKNGQLLQKVDYEITKDPKVIEKLMRQELSEGLEGIIVKRADSRYVAGRTGWRWVKMKEMESAHAKLADTVDCVVMGYSRGKGKRAGFGVGQFLVGIRDRDKIKTVSKVGTGITDEEFGELNKRLSKLMTKKKPKEYVVHKDLEPDFWVEPKLVVEIAADEITKSPNHSSGLALRFPRLIKFRDDKLANQATSLKELKRLFKLQK